MSPRTQYYTIFLARVATLLYTIAICVLSLMPGKDVPLGSVSDKYRHALAYGLFAVLLGLSFLKGRYWAAAWAFTIASLVGIGMEILQPYFGRSQDVGDALANSIGATLGCVVFVSLLLMIPRKHVATGT
jgi:VanZ family protein